MAKNKAEPKHGFETVVPHQVKYTGKGDDNWDLATTACPLDSPKINTQPGNAMAVTAANRRNERCYSGTGQSAYIHRSHTNGGNSGA